MLCEVLSLVRPCSYALALDFGVMFSKVCIPLTTRCLRAPLLYSAGLVILRDHTNRACDVAATMYRREQGPRCFAWKLDSEDSGEQYGRGLPECISETHLRMGKARGYPRSYRTRSLAIVRDSCERLERGLGGSLHTSRYLGKNTGVVHGVCISTSSLASSYILQSWLCALHFLA
jgi:hypothetical protein